MNPRPHQPCGWLHSNRSLRKHEDGVGKKTATQKPREASRHTHSWAGNMESTWPPFSSLALTSAFCDFWKHGFSLTSPDTASVLHLKQACIYRRCSQLWWCLGIGSASLPIPLCGGDERDHHTLSLFHACPRPCPSFTQSATLLGACVGCQAALCSRHRDRKMQGQTGFLRSWSRCLLEKAGSFSHTQTHTDTQEGRSARLLIF